MALIVLCVDAAPLEREPSRDRLRSPVQDDEEVDEELEAVKGGSDEEMDEAQEEGLPPPPIPQGGFTAASLFSICHEGDGEERDGLPSKPSRSSSSMKRPKLMRGSSPGVVEIEDDDRSGQAP